MLMFMVAFLYDSFTSPQVFGGTCCYSKELSRHDRDAGPRAFVKSMKMITAKLFFFRI